jgi:hypothetical protein
MDTEQGGHLVIPFYLLIGFALEGALKAYLSHAGVGAQKLRSKELRHGKLPLRRSARG